MEISKNLKGKKFISLLEGGVSQEQKMSIPQAFSAEFSGLNHSSSYISIGQADNYPIYQNRPIRLSSNSHVITILVEKID